MPILFYRTADPYGCFSNFSKHPVHIYGSRFPTSEHAFQAMKFFPHRSDLLKRVLAAPTPREAAKLGRDPSSPLHPNWEKDPQSILSFRLPEAYDELLQPDDGTKHEEPLFNRLKDLIMYEVVYAKTLQHPGIKSTLLETGTEAIIEDSANDKYWAWGPEHDGENKLGRIWMAARNAIRRGIATATPFGKPERVDFVCTASYPWQTEYGNAVHPDATSTGRVGPHYEGFRCPNCEHYFEAEASSAAT